MDYNSGDFYYDKCYKGAWNILGTQQMIFIAISTMGRLLNGAMFSNTVNKDISYSLSTEPLSLLFSSPGEPWYPVFSYQN